ncbi:hypothetical protein MCOR23_009430 [Pyricularia oryzae]|nr:hypothetical protein MCOR23_009430 [Pyricularia oryzae]
MSTSGMAASAFEHAPLAPHLSPGIHPVAMSRPQVGIERLPTRRMSNEPRESMNCKSCRKRKIKCNRLRPSCEACQVFQCPCVYDAVPKKRGPKTDVLEALVKRIDGLEQQLKDKKTADPSGTEVATIIGNTRTASNASIAPDVDQVSPSASAGPAAGSVADEDLKSRIDPALTNRSAQISESAIYSPSPGSEPSSMSITVPTEALLDTYFSRFHGKPYHILDETVIKQRIQAHQIPSFLAHAIYAVSARYIPHPSGYQSAVQLSEDYAIRARSEIDTDEPSVDALQALLLLVTAFTAMGKGRKAYMLLTSAVGMAVALELHREVDPNARISPAEREMRRRLFWSCFLLDRFMACGSKRPSLISNRTIIVRLPSWSPGPQSLPVEGEFFVSGSNLHYFQGSGKKSQGSSGMLIDISRILGITNRYLAAGGVKGDSHFPWHSLSNLSKIRQDLDIWASGTEDVFSSLDKLFGQPDSTVLVLSKLIYHLIHCLIYRPFLPIDLGELAGAGQHQSWQIEATNMCFLHANAIAELVELGKQTATIEWPAFVGYCICTAGTVHVHGAFYNKNRFASGEMGGVLASSTDFLSREMQQLSELRYAWASVQHQRETLQGIYGAHAELVKSHASNPMRSAPVFQLEDFFDRYSNIGGPGGQSFYFDSANISLSDVVVDYTTDVYTGHDLYAPRSSISVEAMGAGNGSDRPNLKRKKTAPHGNMKAPDLRLQSISTNMPVPHTPHGLPTPSHHRHSFSFQPPQGSPVLLHSPGAHHHPIPGATDAPSSHPTGPGTRGMGSVGEMHTPAGHHLQSHQGGGISTFSPTINYSPPPGQGGGGGGNRETPSQQQQQGSGATPGNTGQSSYDPMFGTLPTNAFSSPAPGPWHHHAVPGGENDVAAAPGAAAGKTLAHSPGAGSNANEGGAEEKDPFLSLLEQLAENEQAMGSGGELDFFLGMSQR